MKWIYRDEPFSQELIEDNFGFVYICQEISTGKKYIGRKNFLFKRTRPALKGQKKKRKDNVYSGWKEYCTSNDAIKEKCKGDGWQNFTWTILHLVDTQAMLKYLETKEIMAVDAVFDDIYYNGNVQINIKRKK